MTTPRSSPHVHADAERDAHTHDAPAAPTRMLAGFSLLTAAASTRLAFAAGLAALLWLVAWWAMRGA